MSAAQAHGHAALEWWRRHPVNYMFQWLALLPLIGAALVQDQLAAAVEHARTLLVPSQQRLPEPLTALLEAVLHAWDGNEPETARTCLRQAVELARESGYL